MKNRYESLAAAMRDAIENPGKHPEVLPKSGILPSDKQKESKLAEILKKQPEKDWLREWEEKNDK